MTISNVGTSMIGICQGWTQSSESSRDGGVVFNDDASRLERFCESTHRVNESRDQTSMGAQRVVSPQRRGPSRKTCATPAVCLAAEPPPPDRVISSVVVGDAVALGRS